MELLRIITLSLAEDGIDMSRADIDRLVDTLFLAADRGRDGRVSFEEFEAIVHAHPDVLEVAGVALDGELGTAGVDPR